MEIKEDRNSVKDELRAYALKYSFKLPDLRKSTEILKAELVKQRKRKSYIDSRIKRKKDDELKNHQEVTLKNTPIYKTTIFKRAAEDEKVNFYTVYGHPYSYRPDLAKLLGITERRVRNILRRELRSRRNIDVIFTLKTLNRIPTGLGNNYKVIWKDYKRYLRANNMADVTRWYSSLEPFLMKDIGEYIQDGQSSAVVLHAINGFVMEVSSAPSIVGGYFRKMPAKLSSKKCCVNVLSPDNDNKCLLYSIMASIMAIPDKANRFTYYNPSNGYDPNNKHHKKLFELKGNNFNPLAKGDKLYKCIKLPPNYYINPEDENIYYRHNKDLLDDRKDGYICDGIDVLDITKISTLNNININAFNFEIQGASNKAIMKLEDLLDRLRIKLTYDKEDEAVDDEKIAQLEKKIETTYKKWCELIEKDGEDKKSRFRITPINGKSKYNPDWFDCNLCLYIDHYMWIKNFNRFINSNSAKTSSAGSKNIYCYNCLCKIKDPNHILKCYKLKQQVVEMPKRWKLSARARELKRSMGADWKLEYGDLEEQFTQFKYKQAELYVTKRSGSLINKSQKDLYDAIGCGNGIIAHETKADTWKLRETIHIPVQFHYADGRKYNYQENVLVCDFESVLEKVEGDPNITQLHKAIAYRLYGFNTKTNEKWLDRCYIGEAADMNLIDYMFSDKAMALMYGKLVGNYRHIPMFFHNSSGYDSNFIVKRLAKIKNLSLDTIARGNTKYISLTFKCYKILDSCCFLPSALGSLINNLEDNQKKILKKEIPNFKGGKELFPYEWLDTIDKLKDTRLPPPVEWGSSLNGTVGIGLSNNDWSYVNGIWEKYGMTSFKDYLDHYLKIDVYGLADVIREFRNQSLLDYELDPFNCITLPSFGWRSFLKKSGVKLETITDPEMYNFFTNGIRGGITQAIHRYAEAKNGYELMYIDANNLYGLAMTWDLPVKDFKWLTEYRCETINETHLVNMRNVILEVDMIIPDEKHDYLSDFPPAPESITVNINDISPYSKARIRNNDLKNLLEDDKERGTLSQDVADLLGLSVGTAIKGEVEVALDELLDSECSKNTFVKDNKKLICSLLPKKNYIAHIETLKLYLKLGCRITKIHRGVAFHSAPVLKGWIEFNTEKRKNARNSFEKDFYKLMNNSVFGKTMENVRNHGVVKFTNDPRIFRLMKSRYIYGGSHVIDYENDYIQMNLRKRAVVLNKPIYLGLSILEFSKIHMYRTYYEVLKKIYPDIKLCYMDTDSFVIMIKSKSGKFYDDIVNDPRLDNIFDLSNMTSPGLSKYHTNKHKKALGYFKHERFGITEFVGLRAKMYAMNGYETSGKEELYKIEKKAKGIKKPVKKGFSFDYYKEALHSTRAPKKFPNIGLRKLPNCDMTTYTIAKSGLSGYDDKRYIMDDGVTTLPYGHYSLR